VVIAHIRHDRFERAYDRANDRLTDAKLAADDGGFDVYKVLRFDETVAWSELTAHDEATAVEFEAAAIVEDAYRSMVIASQNLTLAFETEAAMASLAVPNVDLHDPGPPGHLIASNPLRPTGPPCQSAVLYSAGALAMAA
jgi:hypothetical protein